MTDCEMLEMAAKAAGYKATAIDGGDFLVSEHEEEGDETFWIKWNPLQDDGDALRLAVKLKIDIHQRVAEPRVAAIAAMQSPKIESVADEKQRLVATRRAIVRAAAEIGKAMP